MKNINTHNNFISGSTATTVFTPGSNLVVTSASTSPLMNHIVTNAALLPIVTEGNSISTATYTTSADQSRFDQILNTNFDMVSTNILFGRIKDYEHKFKSPSGIFMKKWYQGEVQPTPEIHDWMNTYRELFDIKANGQ